MYKFVNCTFVENLWFYLNSTAVLHLYYARFVCHFLHSIGLLNHREPFINLLTQGMVKGESFRVKDTGKYLPRDKVDTSGKYVT